VIYVIIGRRELGKTTLARYLGHARSPRLTIDPRAQWPLPPSVTTTDDDDDAIPGVMFDVNPALVLEDLESDRDVLVQPNDLEDAIASLAWPARQYITGSPSRQLTITFDEAGLYTNGLRSHWSWMMRCSPRDRTTILLTAHRPADVATDIRALADIWCIFRTTQVHDLDAIEDRCGPEVRALVQTLKPYEFVSWNDAKAEMQHHKNPQSWYTPAAAPLQGEPIAPRRRLF
jgi:hypothetical protein